MASPDLVLASTSAVRAQLLEGAGLDFTTADSQVDEDAIKEKFAGGQSEADTDQLAIELAAAKALSVSAHKPSALVLGADQILSCAGKRYDKPKDMAEARRNLLAFRGQTHILHSGLALVLGGEIVWRHSARALLTMRDFSEDWLDAYLDRLGTKVMKSVGCYQLEGPGVQLFTKIDGDYFTILGLPLLPLLEELRLRGVVAS